MKQQTKRRRRGRSVEGATENVVDHSHQSLLINLDEENSPWYEIGAELPGRNSTIVSDPPKAFHEDNKLLVMKYRTTADSLFQTEMQVSRKASIHGSDERWVENTMKKGTLKDRIAAISVTVSTDPIHKFESLDGLLAMAGCSESGGKTNSRVAQLASEALEDLFVNTLLPIDRKLISLDQRPLYLFESSKEGKKSGKTLSPRVLLLWRFEEKVKSKYDLFLRKYLCQTLQEGLEIHKVAALHSASSLLSAAPEGEQQLLAMVVNKLGDPGKKTSSAAGHQLRLILQKHPNMQVVVAREVQQLAHRSHLSERALYNCVVFLNQLKLEKKEALSNRGGNLPVSLIETYFRLFEVAVKERNRTKSDSGIESMNSRLLSALLSGVNRARPYLPKQNQAMDEHVDSLYRVAHAATPSASTQALMLLFHLLVGTKTQETEIEVSEKDSMKQNRFYRALYSSLSKPSYIAQGKHSAMFFNLLYRAMKYDDDEGRVNAFAKRLMSTALHTNVSTLAGSIFLLNEISRSKPGLRVCVENIPVGHANLLVLDDSKREPSVAIVAVNGGNAESSRTEHTANGKNAHPPSWELALVSRHFHPSVSTFGTTIGEISYAGDPLRDFGLAPFLDKLAYRNPKSTKKVSERYNRRQSIAERRSGTEFQKQSHLEIPVNDPKFLEKEHVNEQDKFFLKYFSERARRDEIKGKQRQQGKSEETDDEDDDELDGADAHSTVDAVIPDHLATKSFAEIEKAWETDSEEEAFVDTLAEKLIENAADSELILDDEDPSMSDWSDYGPNEESQRSSPEHDFPLDDYSEDDDYVLDVVGDDLNGNVDDDFNVFVNANEYDNGHADLKRSSRKRRRQAK